MTPAMLSDMHKHQHKATHAIGGWQPYLEAAQCKALKGQLHVKLHQTTNMCRTIPNS